MNFSHTVSGSCLTLFAIILLFPGCASCPKETAGVWKTMPDSTLSVTTNTGLFSTLFDKLEIVGGPESRHMTAAARLRLVPVDPDLRYAKIELRGGLAYSQHASAVCVLKWNGDIIYHGPLPCEEEVSATNRNWYVYALIPANRIHHHGDRLAVYLGLSPGDSPAADSLTLDSVDVNWQTNRMPAVP